MVEFGATIIRIQNGWGKNVATLNACGIKLPKNVVLLTAELNNSDTRGCCDNTTSSRGIMDADSWDTEGR